MSKLVERGLRRQRAIQQSRGTVLSMLIVALPIALLALISLVASIAGGRILSLGSFASGVVAISAIWVAGHLFREAQRLGKLLKDPEWIMRAEQDPDLVSGVHWSRLNPFSRGGASTGSQRQ